jgi:hypothetical protein
MNPCNFHLVLFSEVIRKLYFHSLYTFPPPIANIMGYQILSKWEYSACYRFSLCFWTTLHCLLRLFPWGKEDVDFHWLELHHTIWAWWCMPGNPSTQRQREDGLQFQVSLDYRTHCEFLLQQERRKEGRKASNCIHLPSNHMVSFSLMAK